MDPLYGLTRALVRVPLRHGLRFTVEGLEKLTPGPALLASNHISYFDPLALLYVADLAGGRVHFLAKAELFRVPVLGWLLRELGHIPIDRGRADTAALQAAAAALAAGRWVVTFPEGTISSSLDPMAGRTGTARLARETGIPVQPVGLWGTQRVIPPGRKPRPRPGVAISVSFGDSVAVGGTDNPREATDRVMTGVCAAVSRARERYPQQPRPGEGDWWVRRPEAARLRSCRGTLAQALLDAEAQAERDGAPPAP